MINHVSINQHPLHDVIAEVSNERILLTRSSLSEAMNELNDLDTYGPVTRETLVESPYEPRVALPLHITFAGDDGVEHQFEATRLVEYVPVEERGGPDFIALTFEGRLTN